MLLIVSGLVPYSYIDWNVLNTSLPPRLSTSAETSTAISSAPIGATIGGRIRTGSNRPFIPQPPCSDPRRGVARPAIPRDLIAAPPQNLLAAPPQNLIA